MYIISKLHPKTQLWLVKSCEKEILFMYDVDTFYNKYFAYSKKTRKYYILIALIILYLA